MADCTGFVAYDMDGNLVFHKTFNKEYGFITVGEIESICIHGNRM